MDSAKHQRLTLTVLAIAILVAVAVLAWTAFDSDDDVGENGEGSTKAVAADELRRRSAPNDDVDPGPLPRIAGDLNPEVAKVVEALRSGENPERLSVLAKPDSFDREAYESDPEEYLSTPEPGRVWQALQPGEGVPHLGITDAASYAIVQGETVPLKVTAIPGAPVTFTSLDLGEFQNRLTTVTVAADADGLAVARFTGTSGTIGSVNVLAASPMTAGQARFRISVVVPRAEE